MAKYCQFGPYLDIALCDQLVCLYNEAIQRKILAEDDLTLTKAIDIALAFELASQETRMLRATDGAIVSRRPPLRQPETTTTNSTYVQSRRNVIDVMVTTKAW